MIRRKEEETGKGKYGSEIGGVSRGADVAVDVHIRR